MLKQQARAVAIAVRALDLALVAAAFPLAYWCRSALAGGRFAGPYPIGEYWPVVVLSTLLWTGAAWMSRVYGVYRTRSTAVEMARITRAVAILAVLVLALSFLSKQHQISRLLVVLYYATVLVLLTGSRVAIRATAHAVRRRGLNTRSFAVVGTGDLARELRDGLVAHRSWGFEFAGWVLDGDASRSAVRGAGQVLGHVDELATVLERNVIDLVVFVAAPGRMEGLEQAVAVCTELGVPVKIGLDIMPPTSHHFAMEELEGIPLLSFTHSCENDILALAAKRAFDVVVSGVAMVLLAPVVAGIALAIRFDSPGPILFRQRRAGKNGREFTLLKFRSMRVGAEQELPHLRHHNEMGGPVFKMREDPRVTRVGRFLRRTSLDELPQFWNVLRGEMSVVGPRPPIPSEVRLYQRWHRRRLSMKPGMTCTWQVSGRSDLDFERWMELDLAYIDGWTLWRDVVILLRTIPAVLLGRGAR
jgi:exopolysaccharide biosynthesis polyprenyl glycosylphosphotransferase